MGSIYWNEEKDIPTPLDTQKSLTLNHSFENSSNNRRTRRTSISKLLRNDSLNKRRRSTSLTNIDEIKKHMKMREQQATSQQNHHHPKRKNSLVQQTLSRASSSISLLRDSTSPISSNNSNNNSNNFYFSKAAVTQRYSFLSRRGSQIYKTLFKKENNTNNHRQTENAAYLSENYNKHKRENKNHNNNVTNQLGVDLYSSQKNHLRAINNIQISVGATRTTNSTLSNCSSRSSCSCTSDSDEYFENNNQNMRTLKSNKKKTRNRPYTDPHITSNSNISENIPKKSSSVKLNKKPKSKSTSNTLQINSDGNITPTNKPVHHQKSPSWTGFGTIGKGINSIFLSNPSSRCTSPTSNDDGLSPDANKKYDWLEVSDRKQRFFSEITRFVKNLERRFSVKSRVN